MSFLTKFKKNFEQFEDSSWYYEGKGDAKVYDSSIEHINEQMRLEEREKLKNTIEELGFKEEIDYNGKMVLKNNIPIKKNMNYREVESLVQRLRTTKKD
jgi:pseudouridine-5'-phosphate glycosidase